MKSMFRIMTRFIGAGIDGGDLYRRSAAGGRFKARRFLSLPFGLRIWPVFRKWFATLTQLNANKQTAQLANGKWILVEDERAKFEQKLYDRGVVDAVTLDINHAHLLRSRNKRQGWDKDGNEIKEVRA